jgi:hypothetical protein
VTWTVGQGRHTVSSDNGAFDSGPLGEGQTFAYIFNEPGTFAYRDRLNTSMRGTVVVRAISNATPTAVFTATPSTVASGQTVAFDASHSADPDGRIARHQWDFDGDGVFETDTAGTSRITRAFSNTGTTARTIRVGLVVTDDRGAVTPAEPVTVTVAPRSTQSADTERPTVDDLQVQPLVACATRGPRCRRPGARVRFLLDERSTVRVVVQRLGGGGRVVATVRRSVGSGRASIRVPRAGLRSGRYRVSVQATDRAGNRSRTRRTTYRSRG